MNFYLFSSHFLSLFLPTACVRNGLIFYSHFIFRSAALLAPTKSTKLNFHRENNKNNMPMWSHAWPLLCIKLEFLAMKTRTTTATAMTTMSLIRMSYTNLNVNCFWMEFFLIALLKCLLESNSQYVYSVNF